jgi:hypothetical protein
MLSTGVFQTANILGEIMGKSRWTLEIDDEKSGWNQWNRAKQKSFLKETLEQDCFEITKISVQPVKPPQEEALRRPLDPRQRRTFARNWLLSINPKNR